MTVTETQTETQTEAERVQGWRFEQLINAGLTIADAQLLAGSSADLHRIIELAEAGCASELIVRILT